MRLSLTLRKMLAPAEVKVTLDALERERARLGGGLGASLGAEIVTSVVVKNMLTWTEGIKGDIQQGKPPRAVALYLMMDVARDCLASGRFHVYRGSLSMQGLGILSLNGHCLDELVKLGQMTSDDAMAAKAATNEDIRAVG